MYRMFKIAPSIRAATQVFNSLATTPLARPAKFLSSLPLPVYSSALQNELRAVIKINAEARDKAEALTHYRRVLGDNFFKRELKLSEREWSVIKLVIERAYQKYGVRSLSVDDTWDWKTIAIVTNPEVWIGDEVEKRGKSLEEALITALKRMVPNVPCSGVEDLVSMVSMKPAVASEINKETVEAGGAIQPK